MLPSCRGKYSYYSSVQFCFLQAANYTQPRVHLKINAISMVKITVLDQSYIIVVVITVME